MSLGEHGTAQQRERIALLSRAAFDALPEYSASVPTGVVIGKRWRRWHQWIATDGVRAQWLMGEYVDDGASGLHDRHEHGQVQHAGRTVLIRWRKICLVSNDGIGTFMPNNPGWAA